jgi:hypothetical protein
MTLSYEKLAQIKNIEVEEIELPEVQESIVTEADSLLGDLNPRYFEEIITLKEAKNKIFSARNYVSYDFNPFGL